MPRSLHDWPGNRELWETVGIQVAVHALGEVLFEGEADLGDDGVYGVLDLCLECRACKTECPTGVDVARFMPRDLAVERVVIGVVGEIIAVGIHIADGGCGDDVGSGQGQRAPHHRSVGVHGPDRVIGGDHEFSGLVCIEIAHAHGVLVTVDAAGQIYPLENFGKYVRMGADFQCVAAKYMGAPQSTGLALGSEEFIHKLGLQSFASYEGRRIRGVGRPQKIDRQEIVGCAAAVERWMTLDHESRLADAEQRSMVMVDALQGIPGVTATLIENIKGHHAFGVQFASNKAVNGMSNQEIIDRLKQGDPPIWTRVREGDTGIILHAFGLNRGEDKVVGERIAALFGK